MSDGLLAEFAGVECAVDIQLRNARAKLRRARGSAHRPDAGRPSIDLELMIGVLIVGYHLRHSESAALRQKGFQVASCVNFR
jgi:hypothetical protein